MSKIPVFVSCPSLLNSDQEKKNEMINNLLQIHNLERRALGTSDYPLRNPLSEVYALAKHCAGGIILGFEQFYCEKGIQKKGTAEEKAIGPVSMPTAWNNLEAGILYSLHLPLLILKENNITGGIFDTGMSPYFVHSFDSGINLQQVFSTWAGEVSNTYYSVK